MIFDINPVLRSNSRVTMNYYTPSVQRHMLTVDINKIHNTTVNCVTLPLIRHRRLTAAVVI